MAATISKPWTADGQTFTFSPLVIGSMAATELTYLHAGEFDTSFSPLVIGSMAATSRKYKKTPSAGRTFSPLVIGSMAATGLRPSSCQRATVLSVPLSSGQWLQPEG